MKAIIFALLTSCNLGFASLTETTGYVEVDGGKVFYKMFYNPKTANKTPVFVLSGGPGSAHNYYLPIAPLAEERPVVFYDQLGCGKSMDYDKMRMDLWTVERYADDLHRLIRHLGFKRVNLLGHSWGSAMALEYYSRHPLHVKKIVFAGSFFSTAKWTADAMFLRALLPDNERDTLNTCEKDNSWDKEECKKAVQYYYARHLNRLDPWPENTAEGDKGFGLEVYLHMWGPNEFTAQGTLRGYDITSELSKIRVPTLFLIGRFDQAQPGTVWEYASHVRNAKIHTFENSSHTPYLEENGVFLKEVENFF